MISQDLSAKYEDADDEELVDSSNSISKTEDVLEQLDAIMQPDVPEVLPTAVEEPIVIGEEDREYSVFESPFGITKSISQAQIAIFKSGHYDKVKIAFIGKDWQVVWGADIVEIARQVNTPYDYIRIGRMKKTEANEYYFRRLLADGNLTRTQIALLAAKYISLGNVNAVDVVTEYSDQLTNISVSYALVILNGNQHIFDSMLKYGKVKIGTASIASLKMVKAYVEKEVARRKKDKEQLEAAAMEFISKQASQGIAKEDLAKVMFDIAKSLNK